MTDTTEETEIEVVYLGLADLTNGKSGLSVCPADVFRDATDRDEIDKKTSYFGKKGARAYTIGAVYATNGVIEDGRVRRMSPANMKFRGQVGKAHIVKEFELSDQVRASQESIKRAEAKLRAEPHLMKEIEGLRRVYGAIPWHLKLDFEHALLRLLRK